MDLKEILFLLERETPNDMEFGKKVRTLIWQIKQEQSQKIKDEQLPGQLDMFNHGS